MTMRVPYMGYVPVELAEGVEEYRKQTGASKSKAVELGLRLLVETTTLHEDLPEGYRWGPNKTLQKAILTRNGLIAWKTVDPAELQQE